VKEGAEEHLVLSADDHYMGHWINRLDKALVIWLLEEHVPCFVAHLMTDKELKSFYHQDTVFLPGFIVGSEAEGLSVDKNEYEAVASKNSELALSMDTPTYINETAITEVDQEWATRAFSRNYGWLGVPRVNIDEYSIPPMEEEGEHQSYAPPQPLPSKFELPPPEAREVYPDRVPWIVPPPIHLDLGGKWSKWEWEVDSAGRDCVSSRAKKYSSNGTVYFDRKLRCQVLIDNMKITLGVVDEDNFSFPCPNVQYRFRTTSGWREEERLDWLYTTMHPNLSLTSRMPRTPEKD
jgi:hypothetical protein